MLPRNIGWERNTINQARQSCDFTFLNSNIFWSFFKYMGKFCNTCDIR